MSLFEAHITYHSCYRERIENAHVKGWKFSAIDGDPVLGRAVFCYLTSYDSDGVKLLDRMQDTVRKLGVEAVRQKVEQIVYDTKTAINELTPEDVYQDLGGEG